MRKLCVLYALKIKLATKDIQVTIITLSCKIFTTHPTYNKQLDIILITNLYQSLTCTLTNANCPKYHRLYH
jgi:hypothetical protein